MKYSIVANFQFRCYSVSEFLFVGYRPWHIFEYYNWILIEYPLQLLTIDYLNYLYESLE